MTLEQHQEEVKELQRLEKHLIELIDNTGDGILRDKFLEWQEQRNKCNKGFNDVVDGVLANER